MSTKNTPKRAADYGLPLYFDMQAKMGHTKHLGGLAATQKLAEFCHLAPGTMLLNVGAGAGISAAYMAANYGCRVVGVDILPGMVASATRWANEQNLSEQIEFRLGDAQNLPFDDNQFDALICESVNVFVPDKAKAMREYLRVLKPGGHIGLTEAIWVNDPSPETEAIIIEATGQQLQASAVWENLLKEAGFVGVVVENHAMTMRAEGRNQSALLTARNYIRILGRFIGIMISDRETRSLMKYMSSNPRQYFHYMGYGLYAGRKPE
ncbi:MAG: class I SAM-dependent methyltransferase [Anaerolineae bacterium]|nr:class I SAM-dependent methyltransferase [Anaerolineae bacterium]